MHPHSVHYEDEAYLHLILTRNEEALIKRAFWAQQRKPAKGDWCIVVREDLVALGLGHLSLENIQSMNEETLRTLLKGAGPQKFLLI